MDTTDPDIRFDENGICNHCTGYLKKIGKRMSGETAEEEFQRLIESIKSAGSGNAYDCVIGVSGGVDSSFVAYKVKQVGLRPLAVHLDNGWNSEVSVANIEKIVKRLNIDLYTHVIDWDEFRDLQLSFLKASIPGMEIPTDHAILALLYKVAADKDVQYIISGANLSTEGIMAPGWSEGVGQRDWRLIKHIQKKFGKVKLKTFPHFSLESLMYYRLFKKQKVIRILDYLQYVKKEAMRLIQNELGWVYYGGKHYESIYTRFIQGYILPMKFNIDKRKAHFSTLICSGQMTREEALAELKVDAYGDQQLKEADKEFVIKKLGLSEGGFDQMMKSPRKSYLDYPSYVNHPIYKNLNGLALTLHFYLKRVGYYD